MRRAHAVQGVAWAQYAIDLSGVRTGTDGEKPLLGVGRRPRQVLVGGYMNGELYDKVAKLLLQGVNVDEAVQQGRFEVEEIPVVYEILDRGPWGWLDEREQRKNRYKTN
jgi:hypothetical protein